MKRDDIRDLFIRKGFDLLESPDYTIVKHNDETVGCIYDEDVYIANNYPSLNPGLSQDYADTNKSIISFKKPLKMVEEAIDFLFDSPRRIDRETREKRVENVRKYFKERKDAEAVLSQTTYDYEKLINHLTKNKEENLQCC